MKRFTFILTTILALFVLASCKQKPQLPEDAYDKADYYLSDMFCEVYTPGYSGTIDLVIDTIILAPKGEDYAYHADFHFRINGIKERPLITGGAKLDDEFYPIKNNEGLYRIGFKVYCDNRGMRGTELPNEYAQPYIFSNAISDTFQP
ncbi:MAG: hypothetical protein LIP09_12020 [Bacteroidales bacterium]|nr:hypothetical protein [Bacteroidales bacterium]